MNGNGIEKNRRLFRIVALIMTIVMVLTMMPLGAFSGISQIQAKAEEAAEESAPRYIVDPDIEVAYRDLQQIISRLHTDFSKAKEAVSSDKVDMKSLSDLIDELDIFYSDVLPAYAKTKKSYYAQRVSSLGKDKTKSIGQLYPKMMETVEEYQKDDVRQAYYKTLVSVEEASLGGIASGVTYSMAVLEQELETAEGRAVPGADVAERIRDAETLTKKSKKIAASIEDALGCIEKIRQDRFVSEAGVIPLTGSKLSETEGKLKEAVTKLEGLNVRIERLRESGSDENADTADESAKDQSVSGNDTNAEETSGKTPKIRGKGTPIPGAKQMSATAESELKKVSQTYVLEVSTGAQDGSGVSYFIITYNKDKTIYLFPHKGDFVQGEKFADKYRDIAKQRAEFAAFTDVADDGQGSVITEPLGSYTTNQVVFQTTEKIETIDNIQFFVKEADGQDWDLEALRLYEAEGIYGPDMVGGFSADRFIDFKGNLIAQAQFDGRAEAMEETEMLYRLSTVSGNELTKELENAAKKLAKQVRKYSDEVTKDEMDNNPDDAMEEDNPDDETDDIPDDAMDGEDLSDDQLNDLPGQVSLENYAYHFTWDEDRLISLGGDDAEEGVSLMTTDFGNEGLRDPAANDVYGFWVSFADLTNAGLESLSYRKRATLAEGEYIEDLALKITYKNRFGEFRRVSLPVVTNALKWTTDNGMDQTKIAGIGGQGQSLFFSGIIPEFDSLWEVSVMSGDNALSTCSMHAGERTQIQEERAQMATSEDVSITGFAMYDMNSGGVTVISEGAKVVYRIGLAPMYFHKSEDADGTHVTAGEDTILPIQKADGVVDFHFENDKKQYLIAMATPSETGAETSGDVRVRFTYRSTDGRIKTTETYSLMERVKEYYGWWYGAGDGDFGYAFGMTPENKVYFTISVPDVDYFTNAIYTLGMDNTDEWMTDGLQIWAIDTLSDIRCVWDPIETINGSQNLMSEARFYRDCKAYTILNIEGDADTKEEDKEDAIPTLMPEYLKVSQEKPVTWTFKTKDLATLEEEQFLGIGEEMGYEQSLQDFGFDKQRREYDVEVKVADRDEDAVGDGDCGSKANFYFQLVFQNGYSSVVLANQQIRGDGFKSGKTETFKMYTNRDFGPLRSVRIIPEDITVSDEPDDKLCIEYINVTEGSVAGYADSFMISDIPNGGWIGRQFLDVAERRGMESEGRGRSMEDMAIELPVTYRTNRLDLLVTLGTGEYEVTTDQFVGEMTMEVEYISAQDGSPRKESFDIVRAMYDYNNQKPKYGSVTDPETGQTTDSGRALSDPVYMFRGSHMDRFLVSLEDVRNIYQVTLSGKATESDSRLPISSVSFQTIEEDGELRQNNNDELMKDAVTTYIAGSRAPGKGACHVGEFELGREGSIVIGMEENEIAVKDQGGRWMAVYAKEVPSEEDVVNVIIYPSEKSMSIDSWNLSCRADYEDVTGQARSAGGGMMEKHIASGEEDGGTYFYKNGLPASGISVLSHVYAIASDQGSNNNTYIDHALVQHVRGGQVIESWYLNGYDAQASVTGVTMKPGSPQTGEIYDIQTVRLQISANTKEASLIAEKDDLAVAIRYTTTIDPTGKVVTSAYRYLTKEEVNSIRGGDILALHFEEPYVKEIVGISVYAIGSNVTGSIDLAQASNYHTASSEHENPALAGWYSFTSPLTIGRAPSVMNVSSNEGSGDNVVDLLTMSFTTAGPSGTEESGTDGSVKATIGYEDTHGSVHTLTVNDLCPYITDERQYFETGSTKTVKILVTGMQKLRYVELEPKKEVTDNSSQSSSNANGNAGWTLSSMSAQLGDDGIVISRAVDQRILEGKPHKINFSNIRMTTSANYYSSAAGSSETYTAINDAKELTIASDAKVTFRPQLYGSDKGFNATVSKVVGNAEQALSNVLTRTYNSTTKEYEYTFTPERNLTGSNIIYIVRFVSVENEDAATKFTITQRSEGTVSSNTR